MAKKNFKFILGFLPAIFISGGLSLVESCRAAAQSDLRGQLDIAGTKGWGSQISDPNALPQIIQAVISAFLGLLGIIFLVLIIYAGFNWMTAQGDEEKVTVAKNTLTRAVIGLVIIVAAYAITYFVFSNLPAGGGGGPTGSP